MSIANTNPTAKFIDSNSYIRNKSQIISDIDKQNYGKGKAKRSENSPSKLINVQEITNNPIQNSNFNQLENSNSQKKLKTKNLNINEPINPGFKKTVLKNTLEN